MGKPARIILCSDGASRGNPGPAAVGVVLYVDDPDGDAIPVAEISEAIGETTNNVAEYTAVIRGLRRAAELGAAEVEVRTDSELLVKQVNGEYRVRNPALQTLHAEVQRLRATFDACPVLHIRRERNREADALANRALDAARRPRR